MTLTKWSTPSGVRSTVSDPSYLDPTTTIDHLSTVPNKNPTPLPIYTLIEPTGAFKNAVNDIIEAIPYLTTSMSYEPEMTILQLEEPCQELKVAASTYQISMPHPIK